jgi:2,4-dienoyl-CoA reductase-like NADH-dependent reductase (Old Yellow Enzyme family)
MNATCVRKRFSPVRWGLFTLQHRVMMAPLSRSRSAQPGVVPGDLMLENYGQRASEGGFIISKPSAILYRTDSPFGKKVCSQCHTIVKAKDYIFTGYPPQVNG